MRIRRPGQGFTLIELLVVVLILAVLAAVGAVAFGQHATSSRTAAAQASAAQIRDAIAARAAADDLSPNAELAKLNAGPGTIAEGLGVSFDGTLTYADGQLTVTPAAPGGRDATIALPKDMSLPALVAVAGQASSGKTPVVLNVAAGPVRFDAAYKYAGFTAAGVPAAGTYDPADRSCAPTGSDPCLVVTSDGVKTTNAILVAGGDQDIVLRDVNIDASATAGPAMVIAAQAGRVTVRLAGSNALYAGGDGSNSTRAGLEKGNTSAGEAGRLTVTSLAGDGSLSGVLNARGGSTTWNGSSYAGAGIGGAGQQPGGYITIAGGTVNAGGGSGTSTPSGSGFGGAGIGGGGNGSGSNIIISGGDVNANGGWGSSGPNYLRYGPSGIGGGGNGSGIAITITGGDLNARAGYAGTVGGGGTSANDRYGWALGGPVSAFGNSIQPKSGTTIRLATSSAQGSTDPSTWPSVAGGTTLSLTSSTTYLSTRTF